ncbi:MAG: ComEC/Rec2 family competence protein [Anaerotignum faecicola]
MKRKGFKGILLLLSMLFALTGCSVSEATQHGMAVDTIQAEDVLLRVDFLNVRQADCALLSTNGHYMVIDGGNNGDADTILSYLEGQGVEKLDAVVGTHPHEDHIGSLDAIINHFDVDAVYMPKIMHTSKTFEDVLDAVANKGLKIKSPSPGDTIDFNGLEIEVLGPQREYKDFNNNSIVLKVNAGETAFLFTGDAEETAEKDILQADYDLQADVLKVGHHGSSTSSSQAFLQAVKPKYAVISVGVGNSYHHPEEEALQRLQSIGAEIYRTDLQGNIVCTTDGKNIAFNCNSVSGAEVYADAAKNNTPAEEVVYIANKKSKKFHLESCASLPDEENRIYLEDREEAISLGYTPCGTCKP